jgi:hypothetical protein
MLTREQTELIGTIRSLLDKLERSMSGVDMLKAGDEIVVITKLFGHGFEIGEPVTIVEVDYDDELLPYFCTDGTMNYWLSPSEGRKVASGKVS